MHLKCGGNTAKHFKAIQMMYVMNRATSLMMWPQFATIVRTFRCAQTCLQVSNDIDTIGLVSPVDVATPSVVLDVVQDGADVIPVDPRADGALYSFLHTMHALWRQQNQAYSSQFCD